MSTQCRRCLLDGALVGVQVALGGDQGAVPGDLPEHVDGDTGVGHPGEASVPQVVTTKVFVAELGDHFIPVGCVAQHRRGDPAAARACEDASRRVKADRVEASFDQRADLINERDNPSPLALGALVDETARAWCGLPPDGPGPGIAVDVGAPDTRHFTDPGRGAGGEDDDVAPALEVIGRPSDECRSQIAECLPLGQSQ
jgi:hypothetical protein